MATIRARRPGVWEVRVFTGRDADGKPHQVSRTVHGGKRDAQRVVIEMEGGPAHGNSAGRTVNDVMEAWVAQSSPTWAASSARDQQSRVRAITKDPISNLPVARLSIADVERWHTRLWKAGMKDAGIKNLHGVLRASLAQAVRWGWVSANVASQSRLRSSKAEPHGGMTLDDVRAVVEAAASIDPAAALAFRLGAVAGARRAELAALKWTDVHEGLLTIDSAIEVVSRGDGNPMLRDAATKTANVRTLSLDADTLAAVAALRAEREEHGPWMFGLGRDLVNPDRLGYWWRCARAKSGIDVKWRLHDLRHWSATVAIGQGHDLRTVAGRLGDADPAMTLRVYAHAVAAADQAVATGIGDLLRGKRE